MSDKLEFKITEKGSLTEYGGPGGDVVVPEGVVSINAGAFYSRKKVTGITIPQGVKKIESYAFADCTHLKSAAIPGSIKKIGAGAFNKCKNLKKVYIDDVAAWCGIKFESTTSNPLSFAHMLFLKGELIGRIEIPDSVVSIGDLAFYECRNLISVTIPAKAKTIGVGAFANCIGLREIVLPKTVKNIGNSAFWGCKGLADDNGFVIVNDILFDYIGPAGSITVPDGVIGISRLAFTHCGEGLTSITIPDSVTSISKDAFLGCSELKDIKLPDGLIRADDGSYAQKEVLEEKKKAEEAAGITADSNGFLISKSGTLKSYSGHDINVVVPGRVKRIGKGAFAGNTKIKNVTLPNSVARISEEAFSHCSSLEQINIPERVTKIGSQAFDTCSSLVRVSIPEKVTEVGYRTFADCCNLSEITITNAEISFEETAFKGCKKLADKDGFVIVGGILFDYYGPGGKVIIPNGVELIASFVFEDNKEIQTVVLPNSIKCIGFDVFSGCNQLHTIELPDGIEVIQSEAFYGISADLMRFPPSLTYVADDVFKMRYPEYGRIGMDEPFVICYSEEYAEFLQKPVYVGNIEDLPSKAKNNAIKGFMFAADKLEELKPFISGYIDYIKRNLNTYTKAALSDKDALRFMLREELIPAKQVDKFLATEIIKDDYELQFLLLDYKNRFSAEMSSDFSLEDDDPEIKRMTQMNLRREEVKKQKGIAGLTFVVTGDTRRFGGHNEYTGAVDRSELKKFIELRGGFLRSSVSSKTDYLICNNPSENTIKLKKAEELGVAVIDEDTFLKMAEDT